MLYMYVYTARTTKKKKKRQRRRRRRNTATTPMSMKTAVLSNLYVMSCLLRFLLLSFIIVGKLMISSPPSTRGEREGPKNVSAAGRPKKREVYKGLLVIVGVISLAQCMSTGFASFCIVMNVHMKKHKTNREWNVRSPLMVTKQTSKQPLQANEKTIFLFWLGCCYS